MKIVIVGGGIIGAALARSLVTSGADVTLIEAGGGATPASFGWVNASFFLNPDHFALRAEGIAAWKRLGGPVAWTGCLCWEEEGAAFDAQRDQLRDLGYDVAEVNATQFAALEPAIAPPKRALHFVQEGVAAPVLTTQSLLQGVRRIGGIAVTGLGTDGDTITGVHTDQGMIPADRVIVAAGIGSPALLNSVGVALPMLQRPGVMMRTAPVPEVMRHVLVSPGQELRQDAAGHIWAPTAASHQRDDATEVTTRPDLLAETALKRVQMLVPDQPLVWDHVILANRPVPKDGLPVIGACGPEGLFAAVMHSGVTLAAITAELLAPQVLGHTLSNAQATLAAPFSVERFQMEGAKDPG